LSVTDCMRLRTELRPGDLGRIVSLHGELYARECGFDLTFEAYVAGPLAEFVRSHSPANRLWIAEHEDRIVGCVAIVAASTCAAQLRWYLVVPEMRGHGLGRRLLTEAIAFSRKQGYETVFLWTVSALIAAARQYRAAGFRKTEEKPGTMWGKDVVEEKYELELSQSEITGSSKSERN
jgi:N-acetylglutamate synthase-like GNAT family acetyltransferase